jgi:peptide-methionine (S)-S-oxide reductase
MMRLRRKQLFLLTFAAAGSVLAGFVVTIPVVGRAAAPTTALPAPKTDATIDNGTGAQTAVLAGGCFWGVQGVFEHVAGVKRVLAGYAGGKKATADYREVSTGTTGHAESVEITFNPREISFGEILRIFFSVAHDPTELNRQGPDEGPQYRSEIFYNNTSQRDTAQAYIVQLDQAHIFAAPIVTRLDSNSGFFPAEDYHQDYLIRHPESMYIVYNDLPKVANLKRLFPQVYREDPTLALPARSTSN